MGGLMQKWGNNSTAGLPGLSDAPVVGNLFRYKSTSSVKRELVILIKPTVINSDRESAADLREIRDRMLGSGEGSGSAAARR